MVQVLANIGQFQPESGVVVLLRVLPKLEDRLVGAGQDRRQVIAQNLKHFDRLHWSEIG